MKKSVYSSINGSTILYRFHTVKQYRSTPTAHPWSGNIKQGWKWRPVIADETILMESDFLRKCLDCSEK
jgi:hypothetical protein